MEQFKHCFFVAKNLQETPTLSYSPTFPFRRPAKRNEEGKLFDCSFFSLFFLLRIIIRAGESVALKAKKPRPATEPGIHRCFVVHNSECITASYCTQMKNGEIFFYSDIRRRRAAFLPPYICHCLPHLPLKRVPSLSVSRWLYFSGFYNVYYVPIQPLVSRFFILLKSEAAHHKRTFIRLVQLVGPSFNYNSVNSFRVHRVCSIINHSK